MAAQSGGGSHLCLASSTRIEKRRPPKFGSSGWVGGEKGGATMLMSHLQGAGVGVGGSRDGWSAGAAAHRTPWCSGFWGWRLCCECRQCTPLAAHQLRCAKSLSVRRC